MTIFYLVACIPVIVGGILWLYRREVIWQEWLASAGVAFLLALIFHLVALHGMTGDVETWSGKITMAKYYPEWVEYYEEAIYRTEHYTEYETEYYSDSKGNRHSRRVAVHKTRRVFDHWEPTHRTHHASWKCASDIDTAYDIDASKYAYFVDKFQMNEPVEGRRRTSEHNSRMISGDPNDYEARWEKTRWIEPVTKTVSFENKIKAAPTVFSFIKVPTNCPVYEWPSNPDPFHSGRVMGLAGRYIDSFQWDVLNAKLGASKQINLIIVGFDGAKDSSIGEYQRAKWIGGKKNDLVITFGTGPNNKPTWTKVFGWSESEVCKRTIESYLLEYGFTPDIYSYLEKEIRQNYQRKNWHKFDYIKIQPSFRCVKVYLILLILLQGGLWVYFVANEVDKGSSQSGW